MRNLYLVITAFIVVAFTTCCSKEEQKPTVQERIKGFWWGAGARNISPGLADIPVKYDTAHEWFFSPTTLVIVHNRGAVNYDHPYEWYKIAYEADTAYYIEEVEYKVGHKGFYTIKELTKDKLVVQWSYRNEGQRFVFTEYTLKRTKN